MKNNSGVKVGNLKVLSGLIQFGTRPAPRTPSQMLIPAALLFRSPIINKEYNVVTSSSIIHVVRV